MKKQMKKNVLPVIVCLLLFCITGCNKKEEEELTLRVCNWEEYIDEGGWEEEEAIDLEDGSVILGENSMIEDFEEWYEEEYGKKIHVEYAAFGTNEEMYNQMTLGDTFDLICPSEYMIMKLMEEEKLEPFSEPFFDKNIETNYYAKGVSEYIKGVFEELEISGESIGKYAAGYMWGNTGIVYNPEEVSEKDASSWSILKNPDYAKRITIKDNVRDAYFCGLSILNEDLFGRKQFMEDKNRKNEMELRLNDTSVETVDKVEEILSDVKKNVYSFESDSGKADMVTGKVVANMQWSGDAVYTLDQAEEDGIELCYAVPKECSNLWFDGWCMLKKGIGEDKEKKQAAEAFVNFLSREDNAVRNMYYIGYTSVLSGNGKEGKIYQYLDWCYGAEEEEDTEEYSVDYFFKREGEEETYELTVLSDQCSRQLFAQYPPEEVLDRSIVMQYFNQEEYAWINRMWTNIRCVDLKTLFR